MTNQQLDFLFLSEEDIIEAGALDMAHCVETIDETFKILGKGDYVMGGPRGNDHGIMLWFPKSSPFSNMPLKGPDRRFMSLISYLGGNFNVCGEKWYGSNIENQKKGLPRSIHTVTLNDADTGAPLALMSGNLISAMRTGAVPGVATKYLASKNAKVVGAIGGGVINRACIEAIITSHPAIEKITLFDINLEKGKEIANQLTNELGVETVAAESMQECVEESDILTVATSGHQKPRIEKEWIKEGALITLTGAVDFPDEVLTENTIVADLWGMHKGWLRDGLEHEEGIDSILDWAMSGQLLELVENKKLNEQKIKDLGDIALGETKGRTSEKDIIIFVTGGLPVEDAAWGYKVYQNAKEKEIGQKLKLWDTPHWA
ncbi:ornithine cyclodeaminase [Thalassobacillus cyri]|uniref:Ornithine cyclodeaminase n=1 Tax=Thalassobacillus cyri TaxID=571932 RepID=A0A1H4F3A0_9BACI|nr:tyramine oxidase subunit B [Thalassobacillus cyri]SEA91420.1 ornithine cyclodeaminase [Thalassobacillus cyri]